MVYLRYFKEMMKNFHIVQLLEKKFCYQYLELPWLEPKGPNE